MFDKTPTVNMILTYILKVAVCYIRKASALALFSKTVDRHNAGLSCSSRLRLGHAGPNFPTKTLGLCLRYYGRILKSVPVT